MLNRFLGGLPVRWGALLIVGAAALAGGIAAQPPTSGCHATGGLPDVACTPGVVAITDTSVLCDLSYSTRRVRPPVSYTDQLKITQIAAYGYADTNSADYEEDHLVPLELGGHPRDPRNLWPQPYAGPYGAHDKDRVENETKRRVCTGRLVLGDAQRQIAQNWIALGKAEGIVK